MIRPVAIAVAALALLAGATAPVRAQDGGEPPARRPGFDLEGFERAIEDIAARTRPSVVSITIEQRRGDPGGPGEMLVRSMRVGLSGVILDAEGTIVTLGRQLRRAGKATVRFVDGHELAAQIVGYDPETSIGLLRVDPAAAGDRLAPATLGASDRLRPGSFVIAVGNPFGLDHSVSFGLVAGTGRTVHQGRTVFDEAIQITTTVNPGDPGGLLADSRGRLVGILSSSFRPSLGSLDANALSRLSAEGVHFALPIELVRSVVDRLRSDGKVRRGWLGADVMSVNPAVLEQLGIPGGVLIMRIATDGPAARAKLAVRDVLVSWGGEAIDGLDALRRLVWGSKPGDVAKIEVIRDGERLTIEIEVGERPAGNEKKSPPDEGGE